jgi:hypothetical protein
MDHKNTIKLPKKFSNVLNELPETGMGYQIVDVQLKSGKWLNEKQVYNSEILVVEDTDSIQSRDISTIRLHQD